MSAENYLQNGELLSSLEGIKFQTEGLSFLKSKIECKYVVYDLNDGLYLVAFIPCRGTDGKGKENPHSQITENLFENQSRLQLPLKTCGGGHMHMTKDGLDVFGWSGSYGQVETNLQNKITEYISEII
jgi:hypothetical protein